MSARFSSGAFVCLRCQALQLSPSSLLPQPFPRCRPRGVGRFLSTATAVLEDDDFHENSADKLPTSIPKYRHRIWKPARTEKLGLPALGKPAEVLVLPTRDRKIPRVPEGKENSLHQIQASLENESRPLTPEEIIENIDQIRAHWLEKVDLPKDEQLKRLRRSLQSGFRQKQLLRYVEQKQSAAAKKWHLRTGSKLQIVNYILKHIWVLTGEENQEGSPSKPSSQWMKFKREHLDLLLIQDPPLLQNLSEQQNVQIDVFREKEKVLLTSLSGSSRNARTALERIRQSVRRGQLKLDRPLWKSVNKSSNNNLSSLFGDIGQRNRVHIEKDENDVVHVYCFGEKKEAVQLVRRELLLAMEKSQQKRKFKIWPSEKSHPPILGPTDDPPGISAMSKSQWGRWILVEKPGPSMAKIQPNEKVETWLPPQLSQDDDKHRVLASGSSYTRLTAQFGQLLFETGAKVGHIDYSSMSLFSDRIPGLPQYLSSLSDGRRTAGVSLAGAKSPSYMRLVLRPSSLKRPTPSIEIFLRNVNQVLEVQRITMRLATSSVCLLLPGSPFDVLFTNETLRDIYNANTKAEEGNGPLNLQIKNYLDSLELSMDQSSPQFHPFVTLNLPARLQSLQPLIASDPIHKPAQSTTSSDESQEMEKCEYMLQSADTIEADLFSLRSDRRFALEYTTLMGGRYGPDREMFRVVGQPLLGARVRPRFRFQNLFDAACQVVRDMSAVQLRNVPGALPGSD